MLSEILIGLLISLIYDTLKQGVKLTYPNFFKKFQLRTPDITDADIKELYRLYSNQVADFENKFDIKFSKMENLIYSIRNELINEIGNGQYRVSVRLNQLDEDKLEKLVYKYINDISEIQAKSDLRNFNFHLDKGMDFFDNRNYDSAIKEYQEARKYILGEAREYIILWNIFLCYLNIKNYYVSLYKINNTVIDLRLLLNNSDGATGVAATRLCNTAKITYKHALDIIINELRGSDKYNCLKSLAISKKGYDIGLKAISLAAKQNADIRYMEQIYSNLYYIE